ncbi:hypothetical protein M7I_6658 [Glarea lozoyensis 74030]|uniref:Uncharacterized protein n=1 Tax=Glarea lozoyensis (strain ATCC 74030 / MF5533) TaxID=1104152 RepID=H0EV64_GLAL7|nr:hypothetical protein M7I_6658 [Glarea lozoyensis 74030]
MKLLSAISFLLAFPTFTTAEPIDLGTASSFAVIAATTITNTETGLSVLTGDVGLSPGTSITGFPPGLYTGTLQIANGVALQAQADALTAYNVAAGLSGTDLSGQDLGGQSLAPDDEFDEFDDCHDFDNFDDFDKFHEFNHFDN